MNGCQSKIRVFQNVVKMEPSNSVPFRCDREIHHQGPHRHDGQTPWGAPYRVEWPVHRGSAYILPWQEPWKLLKEARDVGPEHLSRELRGGT